MAVTARFLAENPDTIVFTMKLTMTAKEWCELRDHLATSGYVANRVNSSITDLLSQARKTFYPKTEDEDEK